MESVMRCVVLLATVLLLAPRLQQQQLPPASLADFKMVRVLDLKGTTHHVQGIDFDDRRLWVTSVDRPQSKGWLHEFSLTTGELKQQVEIAYGSQFHVGGISADGESLWIPV